MSSMRHSYQRVAQVLLSCNSDRVDETDVDFIDIAEDIQGRDVVTFRCPECDELHTSLRFG